MRIAFCNRPTWNNPLGGDGVQMLKTKEALERLFQVEIDIVTDARKLNSEYDIVHIFNFVTYEVTKTFFKRAIELKIPIASSSIFWDYTYAVDRLLMLFIHKKFSKSNAMLYRGVAQALALCFNKPFLFTKELKKEYRYFCIHSDIILPNSREEGNLLQSFIGNINISSKIHIVYNGADISSKNTSIEENAFLSKYGIPKNYILEVGRIEPVKNQLNLLYALKDNKEIPIVFVGKVINKNYYNKLKKRAQKRGNVYFVDAVPHNEIGNFYKFASLHVLPSLRESPGLVSLEALSNGCPIVISNSKYTPVQTYFSSQPYVIDPLDLADMKSCILKAYKEHRFVGEKINVFSWDTAALQTYQAYQKLYKHLTKNM